MVKSLKYEHPNKNKSRRKTARIKQSGGGNQVNTDETSEYFLFISNLKFDENTINILEKIPTQTFKEVNDSIVKLLNGPDPNITTEQLCALLYIFIYKIDKNFRKKNSFPVINPRKLSVNEYNSLRFRINRIDMSNEEIIKVLWDIINLFKTPNEPEESNETEEFIEEDTFRGANYEPETESQLLQNMRVNNNSYYANQENDEDDEDASIESVVSEKNLKFD